MNESPDRGQSEMPQELTKCDNVSGVPQEYFSVAGGRCVTFTDPRLVSLVKRWTELSDSVRDQAAALCSES